MKKILFALAVPLSMIALWTSACTKPTLVGSELLDQDEADLRFTDTLSLVAQTIKEDSVKTYDLDNPYNSFPCGYFNDPIFGTVRAEIYSQFREGALDAPAFENPVLDSLVLTLAYDTNGIFGKFIENYQIEVHRVLEDMDNTVDYYSNQSFEVAPELLGSIELTPDPFLLSPYFYTIGGDTVQGRFIQIRLDDALGNMMLDDALYEDGKFYEFLKGLQIKVANSNPTEGMLNFDMNSSFTRLRLYYRNFTSEPDTINAVYDFNVAGTTTPRHVSLEQDFSTGLVSSYFNNPAKGDSLLFLQAMAGPNIEVEIPYLSNLGNIVINKAELDFYVAVLPEDSPLVYVPYVQQIFATEDADKDGQLLLIDDVLLNTTAFGGRLDEEEVNGVTVQKYTINIGAYLNTLVAAGITESPKIILRSAFKQERSNRVVLFGPGHAQYPVKLKMTYTDINN